MQVHGVNCFTARWNWQGIAATAETRAPRDVAGQRLKIRFEVVDRRFGVLAGPVKEGEVDPNRVQRGPYTVYLTLQVSVMDACTQMPCMQQSHPYLLMPGWTAYLNSAGVCC